jgi:hypothetical protein
MYLNVVATRKFMIYVHTQFNIRSPHSSSVIIVRPIAKIAALDFVRKLYFIFDFKKKLTIVVVSEDMLLPTPECRPLSSASISSTKNIRRGAMLVLLM